MQLKLLSEQVAVVLAILVFEPMTLARAEAPPLCARFKLTASDGKAGAQFGLAVSLDGDRLIVGAPRDDGAAGEKQGAAYIFRWTGSGWIEEARLTAADGAAGDTFGISVDLDGDTALVGAYRDDSPGADSGSAYIFTRSGSAWMQDAKLTAADGGSGDEFGVAVDLDGDTVLVGAQGDNDLGVDSGSAYIFTRSGLTWTQQAKITAADGTAFQAFGGAVALDGETALVGAQHKNILSPSLGSAYFFTRSDTGWTQQTKLTAADGVAGDQFGVAVALDGDTALVGAWLSGAAYIFRRSGSAWEQQAELVGATGAPIGSFGVAVALDGNTALVGASRSDDLGADSGSAFIFTRMGTAWTQQARFAAPDGARHDLFGHGVALSADWLLVGALFDDDAGEGAGSAHVLRRNPADLNFDGPIDGADLGILVAAWGLPGATDLNTDGVTDGADLNLLLDAWGACP